MKQNSRGMPERKVELGRIRCKRKDNTKRDLVDVECEAVLICLIVGSSA
jgi:hypothetical protein